MSYNNNIGNYLPKTVTRRILLAFDVLFGKIEPDTLETIEGLISGELRLQYPSNKIPRSLDELAELDPEYAEYL